MSEAAVWQQCDECGHRLPIAAVDARCPSCGGLLAVVHQIVEHSSPPAEQLRLEFENSRSPSGVWRFAQLVLPDVREPVSQPEGNTPLISRRAISAWAGIESLHIKHEGHNPSGSFKDRGMTVALTQARRVGAPAVACASTGNTSASMAAYAALAEIPALAIVPEGQVTASKLAQTLAYGARTLLIRGDFDDCLALMESVNRELGVYLINSINPFRIEGQKTIVLEMLQQLEWRVPEWIALPAGNLGNTAAFGKALYEAHRLGLIDRLPRIAAIQASGAAPFAHAFANQFASLEPVHAETVATAIKIGAPASYRRAVRAIELTRGVVTAVSDHDILEAKMVIDAAGVGCEPASAAAVAGVRQLRQRGTIGAGERVVAVLTGHLLKDTGILQQLHAANSALPDLANLPITIDARVSEVERVLNATS